MDVAIRGARRMALLTCWTESLETILSAHGQQALIGILGEDSMDDDADGPRESLEGELAGGFNERVAGGRDVVDEDRPEAAPLQEIREFDVDAAVAVPNLV